MSCEGISARPFRQQLIYYTGRAETTCLDSVRSWLKARLPSAESLGRQRWLRPLAPVLSHPRLWHLDRRSVAGGVALGLFFGVLIPVGQVACVAIAAIWLRVNLPVAAASTLVTNPFTFPPIYYFAYRMGAGLTGRSSTEPWWEQGLSVLGELGWLELLRAVGEPLVVGLVILAVAAAGTGYLLTHQAWRWLTVLRLVRKRRGRAPGA
jgi:uncharacterized protein (DUF2062 family)